MADTYPYSSSTQVPLTPAPSSPPPSAPKRSSGKASSYFCGCFSGCLCGCLAAIILPFLIPALLIFSCGLLSDGDTFSMPTGDSQEVIRPGSGEKAIAVIPVQGVIGFYSQDNSFLDSARSGDANRILQSLRRIQESPEKYAAVILDMNTPGGEVVASDMIRRQLDRLPPDLPVVTCINSMGASGGYYIASGSDWIVANPMSLTGSVGVILRSMQYRELMDKLGLKPVVYRSGEYKDILSGSREATPGEQEYLAYMVKQDFQQFCQVVSRGRAAFFPTPEDVEKSLAGDGRPLLGVDAQKLGMVDQLGDFEDAVEEARKLGNCPDAPLVRLNGRSRFSALFSSLAGDANGTLTLNLPGLSPRGALPMGNRFYLLPQEAETLIP
ncbi:MAG: signal peptide peptidase SppA [Oligosphaeraceae bacterium]